MVLQVVQAEVAAALALLVPLVQEMMPLVLAVIQPFKTQLSETALEDGAGQVEAIAPVMASLPKSAGPLNMAEGVVVPRMAQLVRTQHKEPGAFTEQGVAAVVVEKVVRLVAQVAHGAFMMQQLMEVPLVPQAEEVQEAQAAQAMIMPSVLAMEAEAVVEQRHLTLAVSEAQAATQAGVAEEQEAQTLAQAESGVQAHKAKFVCGHIK